MYFSNVFDSVCASCSVLAPINLTHDLFQGELSQLQILGGEQQRRQRHTVNRHKHTFPEPHNPSVATPSSPRVKNHSARWCVGKTQRAGEHEKTQSRFCGARQRFWFDAIMAAGWWSLAFKQWASYHGDFQKTLGAEKHKLHDFLLSFSKNGNQSVPWTNEPNNPWTDSPAVERGCFEFIRH